MVQINKGFEVMTMIIPKGVKYHNDKSQIEYQLFPGEYFTGADIAIYFGDVLIDEITGLEFALMEKIRPVFGYASYTWDKVARGQRVVKGAFRIAFKETGYLNVILDHIASQSEARAQPTIAHKLQNKPIPTWAGDVDESIEGILSRRIGDTTAASDAMAKIEGNIWNRVYKDEEIYKKRTYFYKQHGIETRQNILINDGFDIYIVYGSADKAASGEKSSFSHTVRSIIGIQITDVSQVIDSSGAAVEETYQFLAKDIG